MTTSLVEAFDLIANSEQLERRLENAAFELALVPGLADEKGWLALAQARVQKARGAVPPEALLRALRLPELEAMRSEHGRILQNAAVDALEKLHGGITLAGGPRSPLLEALYYKLKIPALRKCDHVEFAAFWSDFQNRMASSYPKRMLANEDYQVVLPTVDQLRAAVATYLGIFKSEPLEETEAEALRSNLESAAAALEIPFRQARLLAQAALAPVKDLLDASGLVTKKKKRGEDEDTHPLLENDPIDPDQPTADEQEELDAVHGTAAGS